MKTAAGYTGANATRAAGHSTGLYVRGKSQKPSSFDLRVSDFKKSPGFNYVLCVRVDRGRAHVQLTYVG